MCAMTTLASGRVQVFFRSSNFNLREGLGGIVTKGLLDAAESLGEFQLFVDHLEGLGQWEGAACITGSDALLEFLEEILLCSFCLASFDAKVGLGNSNVVE
jgi:hypothetical protein